MNLGPPNQIRYVVTVQPLTSSPLISGEVGGGQRSIDALRRLVCHLRNLLWLILPTTIH